MKKTNKIFKSLFNFIDRKLLMPITKLVFTIRKKLSTPNKKLETWLSKPTTLLFISLFLSFVIFYTIDQKKLAFSSQSAKVFKDQAVNVIYNEEQYAVEGLPDKVDVTLIGSRADLYIAEQSSLNEVKVDLTGLSPGTHKVNIELDHGSSDIEYSVNPSVATVIIYEKITDTRELNYDIVNSDKLKNTLIVNGVKLGIKKQDGTFDEIDEVSIRGAEYKINKVATVKALIDVNKLSNKSAGKQTIDNVTLKAYDSEGNIVDVEFVPNNISAEVDLSSPSKVVPLNFVPKGSLVPGKAISSFTFSQNEVTIYGDSATLDNISSLDVEVDVSSLSQDSTFKSEIKKVAGIKMMSVNFVEVSLTIDDVSSETKKFSIPLTGMNVADGFISQPLDNDNGFITVEVKGASSVLNTVNESDIKVYVDLSGITEEGKYTREVIVKGSNPLAIYEAKKTAVTVIISKKN